jgi:hypothetical protein
MKELKVIENELTREELMKICEDYIVPCSEWNNRDSYLSQVQVSDIYDYKVGDYIGGYLPTIERLNEVDGGDWY